MTQPKARLLLIDDDQAFTKQLKTILEQAGAYEICEEHQGKYALITAKAFCPELIFLDVMMPDLDGGQVGAQLRADPALQRVPIVFITGILSKDEVAPQGGAIGGYPFLAKPISLEQIFDCLDRYLGNRRTSISPLPPPVKDSV